MSEDIAMSEIGKEVWVARRTRIRTHLGFKGFCDDGSAILDGFAIVEKGEHGSVIDCREQDGTLIVQLDGREKPVWLRPASVVFSERDLEPGP